MTCAFLIKPFKAYVLLNTVNKLLRGTPWDPEVRA
jgi:hypothetical protein